MDDNVEKIQEGGRAQQIYKTHLQSIYIYTIKMNKEIQIIMDLSGCSEDDAMRVFAETNNVEDAVDILMPAGKTVKIKKNIPPFQRTPEQEELRKFRKVMESFDREVEKRSTSSNQPGCVEQVSHCNPHEEMVQQSNCDQECRRLSLVSEVQIPEIEYPLQSECSCDSQLNDRT